MFRVIRLAGKFALPMPFAEILVSNRFFQGEGLTTVAEGLVAPWARRAARVVTDDGQLVAEFDVVQGSNLAGEPRDEIVFEEFESIKLPPNFRAIMAMTRVSSMCGGLEKLLELTIDYVGERKQFGRPIWGFQAVQHNVARMAGEVAASIRASDAAIKAMDTNRFVLQVAAAKARVGEAAGIVAEIAHQAHGAMGFTHEHELHQYTRRLWAWRDEYGHETEWQQLIGRQVAAVGAERAWALNFLTVQASQRMPRLLAEEPGRADQRDLIIALNASFGGKGFFGLELCGRGFPYFVSIVGESRRPIPSRLLEALLVIELGVMAATRDEFGVIANL
ncbi:MAG: hypothetical protein CM1200mP9_05290 [Gammaproteobacteria bacterium]|nr:MAG: hypothetical protein CM1200mP9_05290 [Gammaproteobacteria bacterium]